MEKDSTSTIKVCDEGEVAGDVRKVLITVFSVLIILSNSLLIFLIAKNKNLRKKKFNKIIISLAFTDLLLGVFKLTKEGLGCRWTHGYYFCQALLALEYSLRSCSIYNFILINLDRLIRIKFPLQYREGAMEGQAKVNLLIVLSWLVSPLPVIPLWISDWKENDQDWTSDTAVCGYPYDSEFWVWWAALTTYIIPTIVIFSLWLLIAFELKRTEQNRQRQSVEKLKNRTLINITVITIVFFICWWPYAIAFISGEFKKDGMLSRYIVLPGYLNSLINPVLYIFLNKTIRKSLKQMTWISSSISQSD